MSFAVKVYCTTKQFPREEIYGLSSQIRRAVVSISSNIAEGCSRASHKEFRHYLEIALGSAFEVETQIILSTQLGMISESEQSDCLKSIHALQKSINAFIKSTKQFA